MVSEIHCAGCRKLIGITDEQLPTRIYHNYCLTCWRVVQVRWQSMNLQNAVQKEVMQKA